MKAVVVGGGSIGRRHLGNLHTLGCTETAVVEPDPGRREFFNDVRTFSCLDEALEWTPSIAVIATPSHLHVEHAMAAARAGCDLFIEKPLSHSAEGLHELAAEATRRGLVTLVGCNMRFHPGPAQVKALLDAGRIGRILFARLYAGSYLPSWRPWQDYRRSYSASAAMGGGCILDGIHEIDMARWYLGEIEEVTCMSARRSRLEIDVEDTALLTCRHAGGCLSSIELDYVQRTYERGCRIAGEGGTVVWDYSAGTVRLFEADRDRWTEFSQPDAWEVNQMYLDELRHFMESVRSRNATVLPVAGAAHVMAAALAAKASAASGGQARLPATILAAPDAAKS